MQIAFLFYEGMTALDVIGPHEVLCRLPGAVVKRVAVKAGVIRTDSAGLLLTAEYALSEVSHADLLVIPGAGSATALQDYPEILSWIQAIHKTTSWTVSVCTGSIILAAAGLLKNLKATTHWAAMERLEMFGTIPTHERVVESGKIITAAGVSAGIDMALILAAKIGGLGVAQALQLGIEYDPLPPFDMKKTTTTLRETLRKRIVELFEDIKRISP
jgi:putative intracellular protease/amidase